MLLLACAPDAGVEAPGQPVGWDDGIRVPGAVDINPDPHVVELNMQARLAPLSFVPGGPSMMWTYEGSVPGPLIRARVGDRVIVHLNNALPEDTTVHWHVPRHQDHRTRCHGCRGARSDADQPRATPGGHARP